MSRPYEPLSAEDSISRITDVIRMKLSDHRLDATTRSYEIGRLASDIIERCQRISEREAAAAMAALTAKMQAPRDTRTA